MSRSITNTLSNNSPLFYFTGAIPVAIIGIGINFIINPADASKGYGIPMHDPSAFPFMWIKGIRDIFSGVVVLWAMRNGDRRILATLYGIAVFIAVGDGFVILRHRGLAWPLLMHWGTAAYMATITSLLRQ